MAEAAPGRLVSAPTGQSVAELALAPLLRADLIRDSWLNDNARGVVELEAMSSHIRDARDKVMKFQAAPAAARVREASAAVGFLNRLVPAADPSRFPNKVTELLAARKGELATLTQSVNREAETLASTLIAGPFVQQVQALHSRDQLIVAQHVGNAASASPHAAEAFVRAVGHGLRGEGVFGALHGSFAADRPEREHRLAAQVVQSALMMMPDDAQRQSILKAAEQRAGGALAGLREVQQVAAALSSLALAGREAGANGAKILEQGASLAQRLSTSPLRHLGNLGGLASNAHSLVKSYHAVGTELGEDQGTARLIGHGFSMAASALKSVPPLKLLGYAFDAAGWVLKQLSPRSTVAPVEGLMMRQHLIAQPSS